MIVIVGCGAIGSHVAQFLRGESLKLVDFDRVEAKNTEAQFFGRRVIGANKADALTAQLVDMWHRRDAVSVPRRITEQNAAAVLRSAALVLDCLDNGPSRRIVQVAAREANIPCLHVGLAEAGSYGAVMWTSKFQPDDAPAGAATCENGDHLAFIAVVAAHAAQEATRFLRGHPPRSWAISGDGTARGL